MVCPLVFIAAPLLAHTQPTPRQHTIPGELHIEHFDSAVFPGSHTLRIWLPPGYTDPSNAQRKYPVLYLFDGQNLFDDSSSPWPSNWQIGKSLTKLVIEHEVEPVIVVGIDSPVDGAERASELLPIPDTIGPYKFVPHGDRLPEFMSAEVMPRVEKEFRIRKGRASTAVGGSSYGGVAAIYLLMTMPDTIGLGLIESPSGSPGNGEIARWTKHLYIAPLRVSVGVGDIESHRFRDMLIQLGLDPDANDRAFARISRAVAANLRESGGADSHVRFYEDPKGTHSEDAWARRFPAAIEFLFPSKDLAKRSGTKKEAVLK